jgi:homoserine/homoserine lactone efflux protein
MTLETWLLYIAACLAATLTPGPAVLATMSVGLRSGALSATWTAAGVATANIIWIALSVAGLSAVMATSTTLFLALKWAGAAYLIYLGLRLILRRSNAAEAVAASRSPSLRAAFTRGFVVQITNPKAVIFFGALFPQFITPGHVSLAQYLILTVTLFAIEWLVLTGYGTLAAQGSRLAGGARWATVTDKTSGALMIGAGLGLAALRRN